MCTLRLLYVMKFASVVLYCKCYQFLCAYAKRTLCIFENKNAKTNTELLSVDYGALEIIALDVQNFCGHFIPLRFLCMPRSHSRVLPEISAINAYAFFFCSFCKIFRCYSFPHKNAFSYSAIVKVKRTYFVYDKNIYVIFIFIVQTTNK